MTNANEKANNKGPKLSKKRQEALFETIKQDVAEESLGSLLTSMNRIVKRAEHQAEVSAIVERFNKLTVDTPTFGIPSPHSNGRYARLAAIDLCNGNV